MRAQAGVKSEPLIVRLCGSNNPDFSNVLLMSFDRDEGDSNAHVVTIEKIKMNDVYRLHRVAVVLFMNIFYRPNSCSCS